MPFFRLLLLDWYNDNKIFEIATGSPAVTIKKKGFNMLEIIMKLKRPADSLFEVSNETIKKIKAEIGEDEHRLRHIGELLNQWIQCEGHLPKNYDRDMIRNFIRGSKFNLDITKRKLEGYVLAKYAFPDVYQKRNPKSKEILQAFGVTNMVILPKLSEKGERICVMSLENPDPAAFDLVAVTKLFWMLYDFVLTCKFPAASEVFIFDCSGATPSHVVRFVSTTVKNTLSSFRSAYALRVSQVHIINCLSMVEKIVSALRPFIHRKVRERFKLHKDTDSLLQYFQPEELPSDYGGKLNSLREYMNRWQETLLENSEWFEAQENVKVVGKPPKRIHEFTEDNLEGSFRKLNVD